MWCAAPGLGAGQCRRRRQVHFYAAAERLVELYRALKKDDEANRWQETLTAIVGKLEGPIHDVGAGLTLKSQLNGKTKTLTYQVRLAAGKTYVIVMTSSAAKALEPYLLLTDEENNVLAEDDSAGGNRNARVVFRVPGTAVYRLRCTSFAGEQGAFTLSVREK
jgi:hypothetical protein